MFRRRKAVWSICVLLVVVAAWFVYMRVQPSETEQIRAIIRSADKIELVFEYPAVKQVLSDRAEIAGLVSTVTLRPKQACGCAHTYYIVFHTGNDEMMASICNHCFDVFFGKKVHNFEMAHSFYDRFQKYADAYREKAGKEQAPPEAPKAP